MAGSSLPFRSLRSWLVSEQLSLVEASLEGLGDACLELHRRLTKEAEPQPQERETQQSLVVVSYLFGEVFVDLEQLQQRAAEHELPKLIQVVARREQHVYSLGSEGPAFLEELVERQFLERFAPLVILVDPLVLEPLADRPLLRPVVPLADFLLQEEVEPIAAPAVRRVLLRRQT